MCGRVRRGRFATHRWLFVPPDTPQLFGLAHLRAGGTGGPLSCLPWLRGDPLTPVSSRTGFSLLSAGLRCLFMDCQSLQGFRGSPSWLPLYLNAGSLNFHKFWTQTRVLIIFLSCFPSCRLLRMFFDFNVHTLHHGETEVPAQLNPVLEVWHRALARIFLGVDFTNKEVACLLHEKSPCILCPTSL